MEVKHQINDDPLFVLFCFFDTSGAIQQGIF